MSLLWLMWVFGATLAAVSVLAAPADRRRR
jgi:hypothetical protein